MKKLILAIIVLSIGYITMVKAGENKSVTPKEFVEAVASVPGKVGNHLQTEWAEIKSHQAKSWAEVKFKFQALKEKFQPE
tara:strand:- start:74 stop:313 length:240 start_codon:yes stop_codon:yes gene_type:complete